MTTLQNPSNTQNKNRTAREKGMVRVEFYVTPEERAILQTVCKQGGHSVAGFMYMLQRKAVAQAQQEQISTQIAILNVQYRRLSETDRKGAYGIDLQNKIRILTKSI